ncbi:nucleolar protein dao-5-like [Zeugodacus cucurbitae]|uniref:nucleolar protein dao-5-like n=1 Tax=Zeugodacus cucurbitae TaxID=28588 RepID=UPI0023D91E28|nr:nucleolar protein dao-5-like [Zeugodacus cucurbitae]
MNLTNLKSLIQVLPVVPSIGKPEDKDTKDVQPISKPEDKPKSPLDIAKPVSHLYPSDESEDEFDKPKVTDVKQVSPVVPSIGKQEDKDTKDVQPISKPDEKPKSRLGIPKPVSHLYSSDESEEELQKPKVTDVKQVLPTLLSLFLIGTLLMNLKMNLINLTSLIPSIGKPEDKDTKDVQPISKPDEKPKSPLDIAKPVSHLYSSDESEEEFDKPKATDVKQVLPIVPPISKPEDKDTKDDQPISELEQKPKSPVSHLYSSDESEDEFDKPKVTDVKQVLPVVPSIGKPEDKDTKDVQPISKPDEKPKSPLDIAKPVSHLYSSDESEEEFDKPKVTDVKQVLPIVPPISKPEDKDTKDDQPISELEQKPKSPVSHLYSSDESEDEFDKPKVTDVKQVLPIVPPIKDKPKSPLNIDERSEQSEEECDEPKVPEVKHLLRPLLSVVSGTDMTSSEEVPSENERCQLSTDLSYSREILDSCSSLDSLERSAVRNADLRNERGVAYFVNLDEGKEAPKQNSVKLKKALVNKKLIREEKKTYASSTRIQTRATARKSKTEKIHATPAGEDTPKKVIYVKEREDVPRSQKRQLQNKNEVSKLSTVKCAPSQPDRSSSLRSQTVNVGLSEDNSRSRSTTPRPRTRTDVTAMPYNATLRTFSPTPSRPKADYSHVTSVYAQTHKYDKKTTTKKTKTRTITKSSEPTGEDAQRKRLTTPTSTVMHRYMQPTLAHSLRYGHTQSTLKQIDTASDITLRTKSPGPAVLQPKGKQYNTPTTTTTDAQRRYVRNLSKEEKTLNFKSSLTNLKKDSLTNSKESIKSTEKLYHRKSNVNKPKAVIAHSESITDKSMPPKSSKEMSNVLNKSNQSKLKHKINRPKENAKLDVSTGRTPRSVTRDSSEETKVLIRNERTQHRSKVPISVSSNVTTRRITKTTRTESNLNDITKTGNGTNKTEQPKKRFQTRKSDVKVQKKIKDSLNESSMTGSGNTSASGSLSSVRKYTRTTTNIKKLDKDVANLRLAEQSVLTTSKLSKIPAVPTRTTVVKVSQEPVAAAIVSTVIIDDDAEITRSFKSTESTKSSTSSSGSRKVLTSEVFTKTFGPDKAFEVIYRQPDTDMDSTSIVRPPSTDQRCTNEFDVSFIDTTDSSLSDSVALPMFNTEQDRLLAASPGSPKPTRSPLALIEETLRRQQAGYAVDPALQMQFSASGIRMGSISPTSSRNSRSDQNETPKGK